MEVTINNRYEGGDFVATTEDYNMNGGFRKNPEDGKVTQLNASINESDGQGESTYIGSVYANMSGDKLKYNLSEIDIENLAGVATAVVQLVGELETE